MKNTRVAFGFILVALLTPRSIAAALQDPQGYAFQVDASLQVDLGNFIGRGGLTLDEVSQLATASTDYEAFLSALHARAPHLFENHVLLHGTGSLQPATIARPRTVLFGDGLFLAFAEPEDTDDRRVEVIGFDPATLGFSFRELRFSRNARPVVDANPAACAACHGDPGKPLWEAYDFWPDAFGAAISRMRSTEEAAAYRALMASDRPGVLAHLDDHSTNDFGTTRLPSVEVFTQYTASLNFLRIAGLMRTVRARYEPLRFALYSALGRCHDRGDGAEFLQVFPLETVASAPRDFASILAETRAGRKTYKQRLEARYGVRFPNSTTDFAIDHQRLGSEALIMAQVRFVLENAGISLTGLTTSTGGNQWFMSTPSNFALDWLTALLVVPEERAALIALGATTIGDNWVKADCETLGSNSRQALRGYRFPAAGETVVAAPIARETPVGRCIVCHASAEGSARGTPQIAFDDTMILRRQLTQRPTLGAEIKRRLRATDSTRMPPRDRLIASEITAFEAAMDALSTPAH